MIKRTVFLLALVVMALPVVASAKQIDVTGPAHFVGKGAVQGRLASADGPKRIRFRFVGKMTFKGSDDLKVVCRGSGQSLSSVEDGNLVVQCQGQTVAVASASALAFSGQARRYAIHVPEGVNGSIEGRLIRQVRPPAERPARPAEPEEAPAPTER
jgi:hypothetical protein